MRYFGRTNQRLDARIKHILTKIQNFNVRPTDNLKNTYGSSIAEYLIKNLEGCPRGVMVKAMDCGIIVSKFVLQSHYYVNFQANTLGKGMNPIILPAMG